MRNLRELTRTMDNKGETLIPSNRLVKFLDDITLDAELEEDREEKGDMVTLITTHSCKGLEYPHVFLVGVEEGCCRTLVRRWRARWMRSDVCFTWPSRAPCRHWPSRIAEPYEIWQQVLCHPSSF